MPKQPDWTAALTHLKAADPKLAVMIERVGPCLLEIRHTHSIFYSLLRSIVYQQLAGKAAATILGRVELVTAGEGYHPTPEQILSTPDERLRGAGLSQNKMLAVRDLAAKTLDGTVPTLRTANKMSDDELIDHISQVRGIGRWTVEMLLMFRLGRLDVLPVDDLGVRKGMQVTYNMRKMPDKFRMVKVAAKWSPYRTIGSWYMWRACELGRQK